MLRLRTIGPALAFAAALASLPGASSGEAPRPATKSAKPAQAPLAGTSYDYDYDGKDVGVPARAWLGRAHVHPQIAADPAEPRPIVVFLHGLNTELIKYRWMGGGREGDVRRVAEALIEAGDTPAFIVAAPSSIVPAAVSVARTSWPAFDLDTFLDRTEARLRGVATIDRARVIVAGHSGGGCNEKGGLATAVHARTQVLAALSIDTCMDLPFADRLGAAPPGTHVIVSWQTMSWAKRPFALFARRFRAASAGAAPGVLRELEEVRPKEPMPHDAMVGVTLRTWLPRLLAAPARCATP